MKRLVSLAVIFNMVLCVVYSSGEYKIMIFSAFSLN